MIEQRPMRVLIVEDNNADARLVRTMVEETGLPTTITRVGDGECAIRIMESTARGEAPEPDLILLDINLPRKNGHEVLASIRGNDHIAHTCVVMCSSSTSLEDIARARSNDANAYLLKPMGSEDMNTMVTLLRQILITLKEGVNPAVSI